MDNQKRTSLNFCLSLFLKGNIRYLYGVFRKIAHRSLLKKLCMKAIIFYQKKISKHTCLYRPTCSQYTLECINNHGVVAGICMGIWRILRCNPFSKGGYDPAPERLQEKRWLI